MMTLRTTMRVGPFPERPAAMRTGLRLGLCVVAGIALGQMLLTRAEAQNLRQAAQPATAQSGSAQSGSAQAAGAPRSDAEAVCSSIVDAAAEARFAWQANTLKTLEDKLADTLAKLEERKAEIEALVAAREAEAERAEARMTDIFSRMRPDAAALQLAAMDQSLAASLLAKLPPRAASAVLNEMEAARAAQLAEALGGKRPRNPSGAQNP